MFKVDIFVKSIKKMKKKTMKKDIHQNFGCHKILDPKWGHTYIHQTYVEKVFVI